MELKEIPGIGDKTVAAFAKAGIETIDDLVATYPRTYRTYRAATCSGLNVGDWIVLRGTLSKPVSRHKGRLTTQVSTFWDSTGSLTLRWFNMPFLARSIHATSTYQVMGRVEEFAGRLQIVSPQLKLHNSDSPHLDLVVPIYSSRSGIKPWIFRQKVSQALEHLPPFDDPLHKEIVYKYNLLPYDQALRQVHNPPSLEDLDKSVHRLTFQELLYLQLDSLKSKKLAKKDSYKIVFPKKEYARFLASLPYTLTASQSEAIDEILGDMASGRSMHRLLHGEVGSGKTVVSTALSLATFLTGYRTVVMAPTQILANQLYESITSLTSAFKPEVSLVTSKNKESPQADILVGTQALLKLSELNNVGLVIVDEQHRFGVEDRERLARADTVPHLLQMTATPIPRSMAQTLFHYMDITKIEGLPTGRLPTKTYLVPENKRISSYDWIRHQVLGGNQAFIVVPLIERAEESDVTPLKSIKDLESSLHKYFPDVSYDLMHGKLKEKDKLAAMDKFKSGITQILVATSMVEVGIDVPQANIMVIEDAERFGLAQLHQLRGRVGRGGKQGYCLLFSSNNSERVQDRLGYFIRNTNGEDLAKYDLEHRGPGEIFGTLQSGFFNLKLGNMYDEKLLEDTYQAAKMSLSLAKKAISP